MSNYISDDDEFDELTSYNTKKNDRKSHNYGNYGLRSRRVHTPKLQFGNHRVQLIPTNAEMNDEYDMNDKDNENENTLPDMNDVRPGIKRRKAIGYTSEKPSQGFDVSTKDEDKSQKKICPGLLGCAVMGGKSKKRVKHEVAKWSASQT